MARLITSLCVVLSAAISDALPLRKTTALTPSFPTSQNIQICKVPSSRSISPCSVSDGQWLTSPMISARTQLAATALDDGTVYAVGGIGGESTVEKYDPLTGEWTEVAPLPVKRHHLMVQAYPSVEGGPRDSVLIIGGFEGDWDARRPKTDCYIYHHSGPQAGTYTEFPRLPYPRAAAQAVVDGSDVYVVGGDLSGHESLLYSASTKEWSVIPSPQQMRMDLGAELFEKEVWIFGGRWLGKGELDSVEIYNPATKSWRWGPELKEPRASMSHGVVNGVLVIAGGDIVLNSEARPRVLSTVEAIAPRDTCKSHLRVAKEVISEGKFGRSTVSLPKADRESVKSVADLVCPTPSGLRRRATTDLGEKWQWETLPSMPQRIHGSGSAVTNGLLFAIGGSVITPLDEPIQFAQIYAPKLITFSKNPDTSDAVVPAAEHALAQQERFTLDDKDSEELVEAIEEIEASQEDEEDIGIITVTPEESSEEVVA